MENLASIFVVLMTLLTADFVAAASSPIANRFGIVGVISGHEDKRRPGVVVLRDNQNSQKNVFIRVGESLPGYPRFKLKTVEGKRVVVSDGHEEIILSNDVGAATAGRSATSSRNSGTDQFGQPGFGNDELDDDTDYVDEDTETMYPPPPTRNGFEGMNKSFPARNGARQNNNRGAINGDVTPLPPPTADYLDDLD